MSRESYIRGKIDGLRWSLTSQEAGFNSLDDFLQHHEKSHQDELAKLAGLKDTPHFKVADHRDYLNGVMDGCREGASEA